jgi:DNA-binding response OmpR family regulator
MAKIMAIDDDATVLGSIRRVLEAARHTVITASGGPEGLVLLSEQQPDLVILDIIMPEMNGLEVCRRIRSDPFHAKLPIIFLTAKSRPHDIVEGLDAGGDDYVTKPFEVVELPARVRALLRRGSGAALDVDTEYIVVGDLKLNPTHLEVYISEQPIALTTVEHRLLHYLMTHAGHPVSIAQLLENVWDYPVGVGDPALIYAHIANLRKKIEPTPETPHYIRSIHGKGYIISA